MAATGLETRAITGVWAVVRYAQQGLLLGSGALLQMKQRATNEAHTALSAWVEKSAAKSVAGSALLPC